MLIQWQVSNSHRHTYLFFCPTVLNPVDVLMPSFTVVVAGPGRGGLGFCSRTLPPSWVLESGLFSWKTISLLTLFHSDLHIVFDALDIKLLIPVPVFFPGTLWGSHPPVNQEDVGRNPAAKMVLGWGPQSELQPERRWVYWSSLVIHPHKIIPWEIAKEVLPHIANIVSWCKLPSLQCMSTLTGYRFCLSLFILDYHIKPFKVEKCYISALHLPSLLALGFQYH